MDGRILRKWVREACEKNGVPHLADKILISVYSHKGGRAGFARYKLNQIKLNRFVLNHGGEKEWKETTVHEACHLIEKYKYGTAGHGPNWKHTMQCAGFDASRCHTIPVKGIRPFTLYCRCGKTYDITKRMRTMISKNRNRICKVCNNVLTISDVYKNTSI